MNVVAIYCYCKTCGKQKPAKAKDGMWVFESACEHEGDTSTDAPVEE